MSQVRRMNIGRGKGGYGYLDLMIRQDAKHNKSQTTTYRSTEYYSTGLQVTGRLQLRPFLLPYRNNITILVNRFFFARASSFLRVGLPKCGSSRVL